MPAMPEGTQSEPRAVAVTAPQRAAKRRRLECGSSSDGASNWEPEAPGSCLKCAKAARRAVPALAALESSEAVAIAAHRTAQRQYLRRKKVIVKLFEQLIGSRHGCGCKLVAELPLDCTEYPSRFPEIGMLRHATAHRGLTPPVAWRRARRQLCMRACRR